ncbi:MAG: hypothetical protein ACHQHN_14710 [Sphingobacteriales bacterium]
MKNEKIHMAAHIKSNVINYTSLKRQGKPNTLAVRGASPRGVVDSYTGGLISLGVTAVKSLIANDKKKYTDTWTQGLNGLYFYDQPSISGPFDPVGMQFNGFSLNRFVKEKHNERDSLVALSADFILDTTNCNEIINDAVFKLRLKNIRMNYSKAKIPANKNHINADIEITFTTSYVGQNGQLYKDVELGKFYYTLRKAPLDSTASDYKTYYSKLENTPLTGKSFIVPRSYGYYKEADNTIMPYFNQGAFSIVVKVTESSKDTFVNEILINTSGISLDVGSQALMQRIAPKAVKKSN